MQTSALKKNEEIQSYQIAEKAVLTERVKRLKDSFIDTEIKSSTERTRALHEVYLEAGGEPIVITRAKVLDRYLRNMTLYIDENPIVGSIAKDRRGVNPFPDYNEAANKLFSSFGDMAVDEKEKKYLKEVDAYFRGKKQVDLVNTIFREVTGLNRQDYLDHGVFIDIVGVPLGLINLDYGKVMNIGLSGVIKEAEEGLSRLDLTYYEDFKKRDFYVAVIITLKAVIAWANRYADLAEEMAKNEKDAEKKANLEKIAATCRWVPENPARTYYEAVQSFWLVHSAAWIEQAQGAIAPGRFTKYTYQFYKNDIKAGRITDEEVIELFELLCIKLSEIGIQYSTEVYATGAQQHTAQTFLIGGLDENGEDATNELDYLWLEAEKRVRMVQPSTVCAWHDKMSEKFLLKCADTVKIGLGKPAFINSHIAVKRNLERWDCTPAEANAFTVIGCSQSAVAHSMDNVWGGLLNYAKILQLTLNDGKDPKSGKQLGLQTGTIESFKTYEDLESALSKQFRYFTKMLRTVSRISENVHGQFFPTPYSSALVDDCLKVGKHVLDGGARFGGDADCLAGAVDVSNSLAAVKKVVFDDKKITMAQLYDALKDNFAGHEETQRLLLSAPKYGNEDDYVDLIVRKSYDEFYDEESKHKSFLGKDDGRPWGVVVAGHSWFGMHVGAQPNGRGAGNALTDGSISATPGTDKKGPTALINSACKAMDNTKYSGNIFNMKFHPTAVTTEDDQKKLLSLIKTFMDLGGYHIQFNIVSSKLLKEAQLAPKQYKNLVVRVAGFSAFFVQLDNKLQEEIIARTEQSFA
ncbi:MAG: hypothetical protein FP814_09885 [Desulfobacterium sp.]|nr:hypothetical protein [Desulfobacterium sp.]MBU3946633.1 hypothetical protein [Pseudomonadota bacterium]MBU4009779.1 hypothetical protein [Pseudomonadota bacterium]MBU4036572.1 hypothetical protein [Pseudomonadota bacterium]